jgi:hypothetical protein
MPDFGCRAFHVLFVLSAVVSSFAQPPGLGPNYGATYREPKLKYELMAWEKGAPDPIRFKSAIYRSQWQRVSFVRLDGDKLFKDAALIRHPGDLDSLKFETPKGEGWQLATAMGREWAFPRFTGRAAIYASEPKKGRYLFMDTGTGLVEYSEKALRRKLKENPRSAIMLRTERIANATNWGMFLGGLVLVGIGFANSEETMDEFGDPDGGVKFSPLIPVGLGVAVAGWIPYLIAQPQYSNAIKAYNEDLPLNPEHPILGNVRQ